MPVPAVSSTQTSSYSPTQQTSVFWRGLKVTIDFLYTNAAEAALSLIAGFAFRSLIPSLAPPFFGIGSALIITRVAVKILDLYNHPFSKTLKEKAYAFDRQHPKSRVLLFIFALTICAASPTAGAIMGVTLGIISGVIYRMDYRRSLLKADKTKHENRSLTIRDKLILI